MNSAAGKAGGRKESRKRTPRHVLPRRLASRLGAVQALYQMEVAQTPLNEVLAEFASRRVGEELENGQCGFPDNALLQDIVRGVLRHQKAIDREIQRHVRPGWELPKLDATMRALLRAGTYELMQRRDIPARAVISEYVQVAQAFFGDGDARRFANGVLDAVARDFRAAELKR